MPINLADVDTLIEQSRSGACVVAGVDEVGRGALAGPVVIGIAVLNYAILMSGIRDSKKLPRAKRELMSEHLLQHHTCFIGVGTVDEINELGINKATFLAFERAFSELSALVVPDIVLVDGNYKYKFAVPTIDVIGGDDKYQVISAASIVAKVYRDSLMCELGLEFPIYGWDKNAGYGTSLHMSALREHGCCIHHRMSYAPLKQLGYCEDHDTLIQLSTNK
jgi:ribonuclease HII